MLILHIRNFDDIRGRISLFAHGGKTEKAITLSIYLNKQVKDKLGTDNEYYVSCLESLAKIYFEAAEYDKAEVELLEAAAIEARRHGMVSVPYAKTQTCLSAVYQRGSNSEALHRVISMATAIRAALRIGTAMKIDEGWLEKYRGWQVGRQAYALHQLGHWAEEVDRPIDAERYYRRSLDVYRENGVEESSACGITLDVLAGFLCLRGNLSEAESLGRQAFATLRQTLGDHDLHTIKCLSHLAMALGRQRKISEQIGCLLCVRELCNGICHGNQAKEASSIKCDSLTSLAKIHLDLGHITDSQDNAAKALDYYRQVYEELRDKSDTIQYAMMLANIAQVHFASGALGSAYRLLNASSRMFTKHDGAKQLLEVNDLNKSRVAAALGLVEEAHAGFLRCLQWSTDRYGTVHTEVAKALAGLIRSSAAQGHREEFITYVRQLAHVEDELTRKTIPLLDEPDALRFSSEIWLHTCMCLLSALQLGIEERQEFDLIYGLLACRKGSVLSAMVERGRAEPSLRGYAGSQLAPTYAKTCAELGRSISDRLPSNVTLVEYVKIDHVQLVESMVSEPTPVSQEPGDITMSDMFYCFDFAGTNTAETSRVSGYYFAFILSGSPDDAPFFISLGPSSAIDNLINDYDMVCRHAIERLFADAADPDQLPTQEGPEAEELWDLGTKIRKLVFDPIARHLPQNHKLLVVSDGMIGSIPLEGLPLNNGGHLIDRHEFAYLSMSRDILRSQAEGNQTDCVVLGDPDYDAIVSGGYNLAEDSAPSFEFGRLAGSGREAEIVAGMLGVPFLTGSAASVAALQTIAGPKVLHLATHAFFSRRPDHFIEGGGELNWSPALDNPLRRSGLALAGANLHGGFGVLSGEDVLKLDLSNTDLVVLSGCDTAAGVGHGGEGIFGFTRAFYVAGARNIVVSNWPVGDEETCDFMVRFYGHWQRGLQPDRALRKTKFELRHKYPRPYIWNSFTILGVPWELQAR